MHLCAMGKQFCAHHVLLWVGLCTGCCVCVSVGFLGFFLLSSSSLCRMLCVRNCRVCLWVWAPHTVQLSMYSVQPHSHCHQIIFAFATVCRQWQGWLPLCNRTTRRFRRQPVPVYGVQANRGCLQGRTRHIWQLGLCTDAG